MRYLIVDPLKPSQYQSLLNYFLENCQHFSVSSFKIHKKDLGESYQSFFDAHECYKCDPYDFVLPQHYEKGQKFHIYELNKNTKSYIRNMEHFFSWKLPNYPEDLSFYKDKKVIFSTITHENMMILHNPSRETADFLNALNVDIRPLDI